MHCRSCGGPSYQDPCASCVAKARDQQEISRATAAQGSQGAVGLPAAPPIDKVIQAAHRSLHLLWTKNVGGHQYDKREWEALNEAIALMAGHLGMPWPGPPSIEIKSEEPTSPVLQEPLAYFNLK